MDGTRQAVRQALTIGILSVLVAAAVHFPLVKRFARGEFRETFFRPDEFPGIRMVTRQEAEDLWAGGAAVVLDARVARQFEAGHVPGARNLPAAGTGLKIPRDVLEWPRDRTLVVYCEGGDCRSSLALAERLHDNGFLDIRVFTGGWAEWTAAGLPQDKGDDKK